MGTDRATRCRQPRCGSSGAVAVEAAVIGGADARVKPLCVCVCVWDGLAFFPTCQVRVVRFYQSCSLPPRLALLFLLLLLRLLRQFLLDHVCINFQLFAKFFANFPAQPRTFPAQCAPLDLNLGPSELSVHRWTSTWDVPSSVCTAGPQPGTFPAQCAPLDLNLGPSELSVHGWTSTWDVPGSVWTAGPQRPDRMPEDMPDRVLEDRSDRMPRRYAG